MNKLNQTPTNYLLQKADTKLNTGSLITFFLIAAFAWALNLFGQVTFPSQNLVPYIIRTVITTVVLLIMLLINIRFLKQNRLPANSLGLAFSVKSIKNILLGISIGIAALTMMAIILYALVPYHFIPGKLGIADVCKISLSYFLGNSIEELIFAASH